MGNAHMLFFKEGQPLNFETELIFQNTCPQYVTFFKVFENNIFSFFLANRISVNASVARQIKKYLQLYIFVRTILYGFSIS